MQYNPEKHNRRSIRLKEYDYSQEGMYFITICCKDRECYFGEIKRNAMVLNDIGMITNEYWKQIPEHFPNVLLHNYIVMPNHVHGIIQLTHNIDFVRTSHVMSLHDETNKPVRTSHVMSLPDEPDNIVRASHMMSLPDETNHNVGTRHVVSIQKGNVPFQNTFAQPISGSVSVIVQQFKSSVTRWCNKNGHTVFQWQSRFHDHIIRSDESFMKISEYICNNPRMWSEDKFYFKD